MYAVHARSSQVLIHRSASPRRGGGYWGSSGSCSACASRASRACEECLKNGPSNSPTTRERTNQAARPIATHHHAFSPASPPGGRHTKAGHLLSVYGHIARRICHAVNRRGPCRGKATRPDSSATPCPPLADPGIFPACFQRLSSGWSASSLIVKRLSWRGAEGTMRRRPDPALCQNGTRHRRSAQPRRCWPAVRASRGRSG